jgi:hypothetical protein
MTSTNHCTGVVYLVNGVRTSMFQRTQDGTSKHIRSGATKDLRAPSRRLPKVNILLSVALAASAWLAASAQGFYGSIVGRVSDKTGAVVRGASVTVISLGTAEKRTTATDADGNYRFVDLGTRPVSVASRKCRLQYAASAVGLPIVIEGYSNAADVSDQLWSSRRRAILVRQYPQSHFQLDGGNLGVVSMKNSPPVGLGHSDWDGVCLVVLQGRQ